MESLPTPQTAAKWCEARRAAGLRIGFVPTMGALHPGHLALIKRAVQDNDAACASIFVNPLQFNNAADLENYPRDFARDVQLLEDAGCAMVFHGRLHEFFPEATDAKQMPKPDIGLAGRGLEGEHRPGHLAGVHMIVARLFYTVGACNAYFGEKDFQQTLVVRNVAREFTGVKVVICPTVRTPSGLAYSSRNARLTAAQQNIAANIYRALQCARVAYRGGAREAAALENILRRELQHMEIKIEYAAIRDGANWSAATPRDLSAAAAPRALVAVYIGGIRLIDNLRLDI